MPKKKSVEVLATEAEEEVVFDFPVGRGLTAEQQTERNLLIVGERARGVTVDEVARKYRVTDRTVRNVMAKWRDRNPTLRTHEPMDIVDEMLDGYAALISDYEKDATTAGHGTAIAVGARHGKLRAYRQRAELLQAVGVLPNDIGTLNLYIDGQITANRVMEVLRRYKVEHPVIVAMLDALGGPVEELMPGDVVDGTVAPE